MGSKAFNANYTELLQQENKSRYVPNNNLGRNMDKHTLEVYERYVLAQFKF